MIELHLRWWAIGAREISMTDSAKQTKPAVISFAKGRALLNSSRAGRELATVTVLISILLVVTKDST
jgi:hypothetical protein